MSRPTCHLCWYFVEWVESMVIWFVPEVDDHHCANDCLLRRLSNKKNYHQHHGNDDDGGRMRVYQEQHHDGKGNHHVNDSFVSPRNASAVVADILVDFPKTKIEDTQDDLLVVAGGVRSRGVMAEYYVGALVPIPDR